MKLSKLLLFVITILIFACNNIEIDNSITSEKQIFNIDNSKDTIIKTKNGMRFEFFANSFILNNNTNTILKVEIIEFYKLSDMINDNLSTMTDSCLLETCGMFYLNVFSKSGELLKLKPNKNYRVYKTDTLKTNNFSVYYGKQNINQNDVMVWEDNNILKNDTAKIGDIEGQIVYDYFLIYRTGWINFDRPIISSSSVKLKINRPRQFKGKVFVIIPNRNAIAASITANDLFTFIDLPKGEMVSLVFIDDSVKDELYYDIKDVILDNDVYIVKTLNPKLISKMEFNEILSKKFNKNNVKK